MNSYKIEQVIAHRAPMSLINKLIDYDDNQAVCEVEITPVSLFYSSELEGVPSYIGIEYMAQTIAAYAGALAKDNNENVKIGLLIGTRKYKTHARTFKMGTILNVEIVKLYEEASGLSVFECAIKSQELILCEAKINVFLPPEPMQFIREQQ